MKRLQRPTTKFIVLTCRFGLVTFLTSLLLLESDSLSVNSVHVENVRFSTALSSSPLVNGGEPTLFTDGASVRDTLDKSKLDKNSNYSGGNVINAIAVDDAVNMAIFDIIAGNAASCLLESDKRRDAKAEHSKLVSSSATNWINDQTAFTLERAINRLKVKLPEERTGLDRDDASAWIRWMKSSPTPLIVDLSSELRSVANSTMTDFNLEMIDQTRTQFLSRMGARLILLPSGTSLSKPLWEPPASLIFGKLLYGGVTRYRRLVASNSRQPPRKAGERTETKISIRDNIPPWIQYGGAERMYEGVDIGPAAILEVLLLPRGQVLCDASSSGSFSDMVVQNLVWKPRDIFGAIYYNVEATEGRGNLSEEEATSDSALGYTPISQSGKERNDAFESDFKEAVGGLQPQIDAIVRRVLDGRVLRPAQEENGHGNGLVDATSTALSVAAMEAKELAILGLTPVRGLLLYGPPGTGKTLLARQIARALRARKPKIVSAPELLDRWVGGSEKMVRALFADAEAELAACNGDVTKSALHVVVIDEIDAVFRRRSAGEDSGEQTRASVVNQILSKLDGVNAIDNVLMIGMTNRRELLDEALLRPGRLEVQIQVPLPDLEGRREILQIHFNALRKNGRLSKPLCCAIDGVPYLSSNNSSGLINDGDYRNDQNYELESAGQKRKRDKLKQGFRKLFTSLSPFYDLAVETRGFSGADIAGLVRSAGSLALRRARYDGSGVEGLLITLEDAKQALKEVKV